MKGHDRLPWEVIWQHDGHVTDVVLHAIADGQEPLVPEPAIEHLHDCQACARRLGDAAMVSALAGELLVEQAAQREALRPRFPWSAMLAALVVAALGMAPSVAEAPAWFGEAGSSLVHALPMVFRSAALVVRLVPQQLQGAWLAVTLAAAVILLLTGLSIARAMSRPQSIQGDA